MLVLVLLLRLLISTQLTAGKQTYPFLASIQRNKVQLHQQAVNSLLITSLSAYTVGSAERFCMTQNIEGLNVPDLAWGTANAKTITLSFWVRSSLTGTFGGAISNSAQNRSYPFTYTISSANTFEQKTITITGDTSGTWLTTSGIGLRVIWGLGVGSTLSTTAGAWAAGEYYSATGATSVVGTNGATLYITGVQLEVGSVATPFERRDYGRELIMCQRYYYAHARGSGIIIGSASNYSATEMYGVLSFPVTMRTSPTIAQVTGTNYYRFFRNGASDDFNSFVQQGNGVNAYGFYNDSEISGTAGHAGWVQTGNASSFLAFSAEL